jgi:hypothetical protein
MDVRLALSKGPNRVGVFLPSPEDGSIQFPKRCVFKFLEFQTMNRVQNPSNSKHKSSPAELRGRVLYIPNTQYIHVRVLHALF